MKTPTLEEVKAYFKNAKEVRFEGWHYEAEDISKILGDCSNGSIHSKDIYTEFPNKSGVKHLLYESSTNKYAEILTYKNKKMKKLKVSKEFILEAHKSACSTWKSKIEKEFPQLFEVKPIEMTVAEIEAKLGHSVKIVKG